MLYLHRHLAGYLPLNVDYFTIYIYASNISDRGIW